MVTLLDTALTEGKEKPHNPSGEVLKLVHFQKVTLEVQSNSCCFFSPITYCLIQIYIFVGFILYFIKTKFLYGWEYSLFGKYNKRGFSILHSFIWMHLNCNCRHTNRAQTIMGVVYWRIIQSNLFFMSEELIIGINLTTEFSSHISALLTAGYHLTFTSQLSLNSYHPL